jgi:hypothetical protein
VGTGDPDIFPERLDLVVFIRTDLIVYFNFVGFFHSLSFFRGSCAERAVIAVGLTTGKGISHKLTE